MILKRNTKILDLLSLCFNLAAELNATHVFNSAWDGHARFHVVWQLLQSSLLTLAALTLFPTEEKEEPQTCFIPSPRTTKHDLLPLKILLLEPVTFLLATLLSPLYGGTFFPYNAPHYNLKLFATLPIGNNDGSGFIHFAAC